MHKNFYIVLLCCGLMAACSANEDLKFPVEETIMQELMPLQGVTNPFLTEVKYPYIIVQNFRNDSIYHIYDLLMMAYPGNQEYTGVLR
jgi:hypothetical protein